MRRRSRAIAGLALLASTVIAVSCTDNNDDPIGRACDVIVRDCHVMQSMGDCIDLVGDLDPDCVLCIGGDNTCSYFADCQRASPACALPSELSTSTSGGDS